MYLLQEISFGPVLRLNIGKTPPIPIIVPVISRSVGYILRVCGRITTILLY